MSKFLHRSLQKELLDGENIPFDDIRQNMNELDFINSHLGGHRITLSGIKALIHNNQKMNNPLHICEIGCGGGDNLRVIKFYLDKKGIPATYTGIDMNPHCVTYAKSRNENTGISFICSDYRQVTFTSKPHIIYSSLFCHHFSNQALAEQWQWMYERCSLGFFVNDLHRHPLAYYSIKWLTNWFSKSYLVKNDAPLSVLRGFHRSELADLQKALGSGAISIQWKWAFRWLIICKHAANNI